MAQVMRAVHESDLTAFVAGLQREKWLLGDAHVEFQTELIATATLNAIFPGLGVGLTIAREIIQRAGGSISIANREGGGLRQVVELPRAAWRR